MSVPQWAAALISALLFGVCHGQFLWFVYAFLLGFLFSRIRMTTGSILPTIAAHLVFNLIGFLATALESVLSVEQLSGGLMAFALAGVIITRRQLPYLFGFGRGRMSGEGGNSQ